MPPETTRVIYDGECPFCARYVDMAKLRRKVGTVELIDARTRPDLVQAYAEKGYDLDEGMVVEHGGEVYFGGDAVWVINALLSENWFLRRLSARSVTRFAYPALRGGRNLALRLLGRRKIRETLPAECKQPGGGSRLSVSLSVQDAQPALRPPFLRRKGRTFATSRTAGIG